jgi:hypothetical protein
MSHHHVDCRQSPAAGDGKQQLLQLLNEALELADRLDLPPEIGARIQEIIDLTEHCLGPGGKSG